MRFFGGGGERPSLICRRLVAASAVQNATEGRRQEVAQSDKAEVVPLDGDWAGAGAGVGATEKRLRERARWRIRSTELWNDVHNNRRKSRCDGWSRAMMEAEWLSGGPPRAMSWD